MRIFITTIILISNWFLYSQQTAKVLLPNDVEMTFVKLPNGDFMRGSPLTEEGRDKDESPREQISIKSFWIGMYEVTQEQWLSIMGYNPAVFRQKVDHLSNPVESVSWNECIVFIDKLNQLGVGTFRLPTEDEWEYACRAGSETAYYWGDYQNEWLVNQNAWINSRSMATTQPVGSKPANDWGLFDMSGNVWEWTSTSYYQYEEIETHDSLKVFRGGSWFDFGKSQRCANRHKHSLNEKYTSIGLRLVLEND